MLKRLRVLVNNLRFLLSVLLFLTVGFIVAGFIYLAHLFGSSARLDSNMSSGLETEVSSSSHVSAFYYNKGYSSTWDSDLFILIKESDSVVYLERKGEKLFYTSPKTELTYSYSYTLYRPSEDNYQDVYYLVSTTEDSDSFFIKTVTEDGIFLDTEIESETEE